MSKTPKPYKLYAGRTHQVPKGVEFSLIPTHNRYLLVFSNKKLKEPFVAVPETTPLTDEERRFVFECKMKVNARFVKEHKEEINEGLDLLMSELEKELKAETEKIGEKKLCNEEN